METLIVVLLVCILFLCIFNAVSLFVLGAAFMRNTEVMASVFTSIPLDKKKVGGHRYTPEENLLDIENTAYKSF
jgi:hypothetical protein